MGCLLPSPHHLCLQWVVVIGGRCRPSVWSAALYSVGPLLGTGKLLPPETAHSPLPTPPSSKSVAWTLSFQFYVLPAGWHDWAGEGPVRTVPHFVLGVGSKVACQLQPKPSWYHHGVGVQQVVRRAPLCLVLPLAAVPPS
jgi:hypothetical protein